MSCKITDVCTGVFAGATGFWGPSCLHHLTTAPGPHMSSLMPTRKLKSQVYAHGQQWCQQLFPRSLEGCIGVAAPTDLGSKMAKPTKPAAGWLESPCPLHDPKPEISATIKRASGEDHRTRGALKGGGRHFQTLKLSEAAASTQALGSKCVSSAEGSCESEGGRKESKWPFDSSLVLKPKSNTGNFRRGQAAGGLLRVPGDAHGSLAANCALLGCCECLRSSVLRSGGAAPRLTR